MKSLLQGLLLTLRKEIIVFYVIQDCLGHLVVCAKSIVKKLQLIVRLSLLEGIELGNDTI